VKRSGTRVSLDALQSLSCFSIANSMIGAIGTRCFSTAVMKPMPSMLSSCSRVSSNIHHALSEFLLEFLNDPIHDTVVNLRDIHPADKKPVGKRLALWALARNYGREQLVYSGAATVPRALAVRAARAGAAGRPQQCEIYS